MVLSLKEISGFFFLLFCITHFHFILQRLLHSVYSTTGQLSKKSFKNVISVHTLERLLLLCLLLINFYMVLIKLAH